MKKVFLFFVLCVVLIFGVSSNVSATMVNKGYSGDRVIYDSINDLYWYPFLTDFIGMTRTEQETAIGLLDYAGTDEWRMATADEASLLKDSFAQMATEVIPTSFQDYGNPSYDDRTLSSPYLAFGVFPADFFTPTGSTTGAFWSGNTPGLMFNGRTTGVGWTNTGPGGFGGELVELDSMADDHFVVHGFMADPEILNPYSTMTFNYDLHLRGDEETEMMMGGIGAWVVTDSVPGAKGSTGSGSSGGCFIQSLL